MGLVSVNSEDRAPDGEEGGLRSTDKQHLATFISADESSWLQSRTFLIKISGSKSHSNYGGF